MCICWLPIGCKSVSYEELNIVIPSVSISVRLWQLLLLLFFLRFLCVLKALKRINTLLESFTLLHSKWSFRALSFFFKVMKKFPFNLTIYFMSMETFQSKSKLITLHSKILQYLQNRIVAATTIIHVFSSMPAGKNDKYFASLKMLIT